MTTLAPLPGRDTDGDGGGDQGWVVASPSRPGTDTVDLTRRPARPTAGDQAGLASWVFGLALALLSEGAGERAAMAEVLAEAAGRSRALEGAYGRAVALLSEYPGDPLVQSTVDLLAKALLRSRRPARTADEA